MFILPALHTLRRDLPDVLLTLVIKQKQAPLALPQKGVLADDVLVLGGNSGILDLRRRLSAGGMDTVVDMVGNDQSGLVMTFRRGRRLRPHWSDCKGLGALYSPGATAMPQLEKGAHRVDELLAYAACLGVGHPVYSFRLRLPDRAVEESERVISRHSLRSGTVVVLNVGASRANKRWPVEHFIELTRILVDAGCRVALAGAGDFPADGNVDRAIASQFVRAGLVDGESCVNLIHDNGLSPALHLQRDVHFLRYSKVPAVVVGSDTGALHIAGSIGEDASNKTISLFGPTNWGRYAPYDPTRLYPESPEGQWNRVLCAGPACAPQGTGESCRRYRKGCAHASCMRAITPETVGRAVLKMVTPA